MKKRSAMLLVLLMTSILFICACTNKNIVKEEPKEADESPGSTYGFTSFGLEIDTQEMKQALKANYDEKPDKTEAIYENKTEDLYLHGDKAMEKLEPIFEELALNPDMDDEDMIKKASETFEIIDYKTLKLKVKFKGHDIKELTMTK
ncbi:YusW family protein [Sporosarcina sp. G11-34]|uniref:YusW family protein n=1 Tax=Sporosarcina sp. G11-34 TaxID=2849605 RepID=UPI0022A900FB|nr:YusW family protein [Sporosarcina sp. G11-34]MCZ2259548.1 YusW family protein [Sporosarcina sp. G11-34]